MGETSERVMRYFIDGQETTLADCVHREAYGTAKVIQGGTGVVPERLRQPGEQPEQWLTPWLEMQSLTPGAPA